MRRVIVIVGLLLVAGTAFVVLRRRQSDWTAASPGARREFEQGLQAELKYYREDAIAHYAKALELDPQMPMAALRKLDNTPPREKEEIARPPDELPAPRPALS